MNGTTPAIHDTPGPHDPRTGNTQSPRQDGGRRRLFRIAGNIIRLTLGLTILACLFVQVDRKVHGVRFDLSAPATVVEGSTYADSADHSRVFIVLESMNRISHLDAIQIKGRPTDLAPEGALVLVKQSAGAGAESGDRELCWTASRAVKTGAGVVADIFAVSMARWPWLLAGFAVFVAATASITLRWQLILRAQGVELPYWRCISVTFIGMFFNSFMLGATGGDLVKAYYAMGESRNRKAEMFSSVFVDRLLGLPALVLLAAILMSVRLDLFMADPMTRMAVLMVGILLAGMFVFFTVVFGKNLFERWRIFRLLEQKTRLGPLIRRVYDAFYRCKTSPMLLAKGFALSIAGQIIVVCTGTLYGYALGIDASFVDYLSVLPTVMIAGAIPVTPGGVGLREGVIVLMMGALGVPAVKSLPLSILVYLTIIGWSLVGGIVFMFYRSVERGATATQSRTP